MTEEFKKGPPVKSDIFRDWAPYAADKIVPQLPKRIKYTAPRPNEELRKIIAPRANQLDEFDREIVKSCLSFLEEGLLEDDFYGNHSISGGRHDFLMNIGIEIEGETITLHEFSKRVNKLTTNGINKVTGYTSLINEPSLKKRMMDLTDQIALTEKRRHYYVASDLTPVDDLARSIIEYILR